MAPGPAAFLAFGAGVAVQLSNAQTTPCADLVNPDTCQFNTLSCVGVLPAGSCWVQCKFPYTGPDKLYNCPAPNSDPTRPLVIDPAAVPTCTLTCNYPVPLPAGYKNLGTSVNPTGYNVVCDSSAGYLGTPQKLCTIDSGSCSSMATMVGCDLPVIIGDPVTSWNGVREEFTMPAGRFTKLLKTSDLTLLAEPFDGHADGEQWIGRVVVKSVAEETVLEVGINRDLASFDRRALPEDAFETLNVTVPWHSSERLIVKPPSDAFFQHWRNIQISFSRIREHGSHKFGGELPDAPRREGALITTGSMKLLILSTSAKEWHEDHYLAMKYSHLDLFVLEMREPETCTGVLPELWGVQPLTNETRAMMKTPRPLSSPLVVPSVGSAGGGASVSASMRRLPAIEAESKAEAWQVLANGAQASVYGHEAAEAEHATGLAEEIV
eukprot:TRINITY_DN83782_c0_g1_i1.p1 TRINITY_DN83782_c0_g1~~TRINITY_DN83782_c0_g1_i1.p1  ORF type:complete len:437 (+),score=86.27 TRINITY_DN83782_c0_g1_i1:115-1425(+)